MESEPEEIIAGDAVNNVVKALTKRTKQLTFVLALGSYLAMFAMVAAFALNGDFVMAMAGAVLATANGVMVYKLAKKVQKLETKPSTV